MNNFEQEYKKAMDDVHASDELRQKIMNMKPQKRRIAPFVTTVASVAAAVMILVVANDYDFTPDTDGVITETVVSTQVPQEAVIVEETQAPQVVVSATQKPVKVQAKTQGVAEEQGVTETQVIEGTDNAPMVARYTLDNVTTETWDINKYFDYIGKNVHGVVDARYVGDTEFEFVVDENGAPTQDMVILNYTTESGASINVMVSKSAMFEATLSGSVAENDKGYTGYKVSEGAYYLISTSGIDYEEMTEIVNRF